MATAGDRAGSGPERAFAQPLPEEGRVTLDADESRHLVRVRRVREGDRVVLFDGQGTTRAARLVAAEPRAAVLEVEGPYPDREPARAIRLATALPEGARADALVSACAELGVAALLPLAFARSPAGREDRMRRRAARWSRLIGEAAKVNGRSRQLEVRAMTPFTDWLPTAGGQAVLLDPDPAAPRLVALLAGLSPGAALPWLVIGPEGGFTDAERTAARAAGAGRARLGVTALRVETGAIAAAAVAAAFA